ncbi:unnamed protein product [Prorocentrum cordatum]|uniref:Uncharacterized protein n=1 Tax=Prorocentrum cordatum TaxID=2364126 RepID=A0ABN9QKU8_9DINO|nr:unnamed protein product [Polarella glacialis]
MAALQLQPQRGPRTFELKPGAWPRQRLTQRVLLLGKGFSGICRLGQPSADDCGDIFVSLDAERAFDPLEYTSGLTRDYDAWQVKLLRQANSFKEVKETLYSLAPPRRSLNGLTAVPHLAGSVWIARWAWVVFGQFSDCFNRCFGCCELAAVWFSFDFGNSGGDWPQGKVATPPIGEVPRRTLHQHFLDDINGSASVQLAACHSQWVTKVEMTFSVHHEQENCEPFRVSGTGLKRQLSQAAPGRARLADPVGVRSLAKGGHPFAKWVLEQWRQHPGRLHSMARDPKPVVHGGSCTWLAVADPAELMSYKRKGSVLWRGHFGPWMGSLGAQCRCGALLKGVLAPLPRASLECRPECSSQLGILSADNKFGSHAARVVVDGELLGNLMANVLAKAAVGSLAIIPGCILFRGAAMRALCGGAGFGFGAGVGWTQGDYYVRHPAIAPYPSMPWEVAAGWKEWLASRKFL